MATTTPNYDIDYDDKRLTDVKDAELKATTERGQAFDQMIGNVDDKYQDLQDTVLSNADKLAESQQKNTDFQIEQIKQQKEQAKKDYTKEQSGAYTDWQKQSNQYGVNAEQMAAQGLSGTGYSESSQVAMYNTYQNRVAVARESLEKANLNYENNIQQAILQNNSVLAQIYTEAYAKQAEIALEGFQYKNTLVLDKMNKQQELKQFYSDEYQKVLNQMNQENALAEEVRQYNESQRVQQEQWREEMKLAEEQYKGMTIKGENSNSENSNSKSGNDTLEITGGDEIDHEAQYGNSAELVEQYGEAYYFKNGYQPRFVNNTMLSESGMKSDVLPSDLGIPKGQNVWKANGRYYAWKGSEKAYIDVTEDLVFSNGYQPKYIGSAKLNKVKTIKQVFGTDRVFFDNNGNKVDVNRSQNIWEAGGKYYVWDGKIRQYRDISKAVKNPNS